MTARVPIADLQPGDLVFFGTPTDVYHVGMYVGGGDMVDSARDRPGRDGPAHLRTQPAGRGAALLTLAIADSEGRRRRGSAGVRATLSAVVALAAAGTSLFAATFVSPDPVMSFLGAAFPIGREKGTETDSYRGQNDEPRPEAPALSTQGDQAISQRGQWAPRPTNWWRPGPGSRRWAQPRWLPPRNGAAARRSPPRCGPA